MAIQNHFHDKSFWFHDKCCSIELVPIYGLSIRNTLHPHIERKALLPFIDEAVAATLDHIYKRENMFMLFSAVFLILWECRGWCSEEQSVTKFFIWKSFPMKLFLSPKQQTPPHNFPHPLCAVNPIFYANTPSIRQQHGKVVI